MRIDAPETSLRLGLILAPVFGADQNSRPALVLPAIIVRAEEEEEEDELDEEEEEEE